MYKRQEYAIRSDTPPENARAVADYLDQAIRRVMSTGAVVDSNRAVVLAALQMTAELFDRYVGGAVEPGQRSLAWRLTFRHTERTLRDRELDARRTDILRALADELNVRPRHS